MPVQHIVNVSGGKDSTACYLLALERRDQRPDFDFRAVFADTGNEHPATYDYINDLHHKTGGPPVETYKAQFTEAQFRQKRKTIREVWPKKGISSARVATALMVCRPSGNPFVDLCILQAGFPGIRAQFCTRVLKIEVLEDNVYTPIWSEGGSVISWQGQRREESRRRAGYQPFTRLATAGRAVRYLPLLDWTLNDVRRIAYRHGLELNPLYAEGFERVGCFPCIHTNKREMRVMAERFWLYIERKAAWERQVGFASTRNNATFCKPVHTKGEVYDRNTPKTPETHGIIARAEWSKTVRGGRQYDLIPIEEKLPPMLKECAAWGVCE